MRLFYIDGDFFDFYFEFGFNLDTKGDIYE